MPTSIEILAANLRPKDLTDPRHGHYKMLNMSSMLYQLFKHVNLLLLLCPWAGIADAFNMLSKAWPLGERVRREHQITAKISCPDWSDMCCSDPANCRSDPTNCRSDPTNCCSEPTNCCSDPTNCCSDPTNCWLIRQLLQWSYQWWWTRS